MPTVALYAGSFDPITNGHTDLIRRSLGFVDRLVVAVAVNVAKQPLFSKRVLLLSTLQGLSVLAMLLALFGICLGRGQGELEARTMAFTTLIIANLGLMMTNRSWTSSIGKIIRAPNAALWWVTGGAVIFLGLVLNIPFLREIFRFSPIHPIDVSICIFAGLLSVIWFDVDCDTL